MQVDQTFKFSREKLLPLADELREEFHTNSPFPHVVVDDFLPPEVLEAVLSEFPAPEEIDWQQFDNAREIKLALSDAEQMGPATRHLLAEFNTSVFVDFLERLTGIDALIPDPHYVGGGLHQIRTGGFLKVHADFNKHTRLNLDRRLNGILYLNKDWQEEWGGHLQLWDKDMNACEKKVLPVFNRFLVFATLDDANHGHPDALTCPPERARRSMALYYYTNGRPADEVKPDHTTLFKQRPGEEWASTGRQKLKQWIPPALVDFARKRRSSRQP
jgi:Rps23 Pro-64 3,4-dihydroxylase Tpa1-like proline 4-hydroxylase